MNKTFIGIFLYCGGMFLTTLISVFVKKTMNSYHIPSYEVIFIREFFVLLILLPFMFKYKFNILQKKAISLNLFRNILYFASTALFYTVLTKIPVNNCMTLQFLVPIIASILAIIFLKEKGSKLVWLALIVCIVGSFIVKPPVFENKGEMYAYVLLFVVIFMRGAIICCNGKLASIFDTSSIMFYSNFFLFLFSSFFFFDFVKPDVKVILILGITGILYCIEYLMIFTAHKYCTVLTLQPCEFSKIFFSMILSYSLLGELATINQAIGSLVIIGGFFIMFFGKKYIEIKRTKVNGLKK